MSSGKFLDRNRNLASIASRYGSFSDGSIAAYKREDEAIVGDAAREFYAEGLIHRQRYRHIADYVRQIIQKYNIREPLILNFGSGPGILDAMIARRVPGARIIGVDLSGDMISLAKSYAQDQKVAENVSFYQFNALDVYGSAGRFADIVVSRNMLHRLPSVDDGLMSMANAVKPGGILFNISFRNLNDIGSESMNRFVSEFELRNGFPNLQEAWVLALLNAPTLKEYEQAALRTASRCDAEEMRVWTDDFHEVYTLIKKKNY